MHDSIPLVYDFSMDPYQALKLLRRLGRISRQDAQAIKSLGEAGRPLPERLWPMLDLMFLVQVNPPTPSLH